MEIQLDAHGELLMSQFMQRQPALERLKKVAFETLENTLKEQGIYVTAMEGRVKTAKSLRGKLELKGAKYRSIDDITDLVGLRVITFYTDDVDKVAAIVKRVFDVDWKESVDKRKAHELTSFGYNSLHYICRLPKEVVDDPEVNSIRFELQMRTALQHVWSTIEHDTGYKGDVKIPNVYLRQFSRLAGMLELIDDEFSRLRTEITDYRRQVQALVKSGKLDEVSLSLDSYRSYLEMRPFDRLNQRIAAVNQAEIFPASLIPFLQILKRFGLETLADVQRFVDENSEDAYQLALVQLAVTDIDIVSETVGLQNLCLVKVLKDGFGLAGIKYVFDTLNGERPEHEAIAKNLLDQAKDLKFMQE